jgi:glycosyltransferase involved in cell wall biosynthesis
VVIPTLNEAELLPGALASVDWADEVIVIDGGSTDETVSVAQENGARVLVVQAAKYARWAAADLHERGRRARLRDLLLRPASRFLRDYFVLAGWRDGVRGFV